MRQALGTLPWVEHSSIEADVTTHRVQFGVKDPATFDMDAIKKALDNVGFADAKLVSGPAGKAGDKTE